MVKCGWVSCSKFVSNTYRGWWQVDGGSTALLRSNAGVPPNREAPTAPGRAPRRGRARGRDPDFGWTDQLVVRQPSVRWESVVHAQEIAVRRRGWPAKPPPAQHSWRKKRENSTQSVARDITVFRQKQEKRKWKWDNTFDFEHQVRIKNVDSQNMHLGPPIVILSPRKVKFQIKWLY